MNSPDTQSPAPRPDWALLFNDWKVIAEDVQHPLHVEARRIAAAPESFRPGALFCELVRAA